MKENGIVKLAAYLIVGSVVVPIVIGGGLCAVGGIIKLKDKVQFKRKIKKGLKEGSIIEIDGKYYEVDSKEEA